MESNTNRDGEIREYLAVNGLSTVDLVKELAERTAESANLTRKHLAIVELVEKLELRCKRAKMGGSSHVEYFNGAESVLRQIRDLL